MKKINFYILFIILFLSIFIVKKVNAIEKIVYEQPTGSQIYNGCAQKIMATTSNISSITVVVATNQGTSTVTFRLCFGTWDTGKTSLENVQCQGAYQIIKSATTTIVNNYTVSTWKNFNFPDTKVASGTTYFFAAYNETTHAHLSCVGLATNPYPYGEIFSVTSPNVHDLRFRIYYETDFYENPATPTGEPADKTLLTWRSDINTVQSQICFINKNCDLWFSYNEMAINDYVDLLLDVAGKQTPAYALDRKQIFWSPLWQNKVIIPATSTEAVIDYCLYLEDAEFGDELNCGIEIQWVSTSTFEDILGVSKIITYDNVCDSISTSTGSLLDDTRYATECGLRKLSLWAFSPSPEALTNFTNNYSLLKRAFPFNIFFDLTDTVKIALSSTTLSQTDNFGIPFIRKKGQSTEYYILPIISSSSIASAIGVNNAFTFRLTLGYCMYLITAGAIFFIII